MASVLISLMPIMTNPKGIELVLNKNNMTWKDTICIGDSTNDIGMLEKADIGVAMGSASDYVKKLCQLVNNQYL